MRSFLFRGFCDNSLPVAVAVFQHHSLLAAVASVSQTLVIH